MSIPESTLTITELNFVDPRLELILNESVFRLKITDNLGDDCLIVNFPIGYLGYLYKVINSFNPIKD